MAIFYAYWPSKCAAYPCDDSADVAGHVKIVGGRNDWYLVPICYKHNNNHDIEYWVDSDLMVKVN